MAYNKELHRQQIMEAYIAAKMERNKVKKHFAYFLKLERVQIAAQEYYNQTYGDGVEIVGKEMSYDDGYKQGYNRAIELTKWAISNLIPPSDGVQ
jgi:hypothetical protein